MILASSSILILSLDTLLFPSFQNNLEELEALIDKWRGVCQEALTTLHEKMPEPRPDLGYLIKNFNLDAELLKYNEEEEDFDT